MKRRFNKMQSNQFFWEVKRRETLMDHFELVFTQIPKDLWGNYFFSQYERNSGQTLSCISKAVAHD